MTAPSGPAIAVLASGSAPAVADAELARLLDLPIVTEEDDAAAFGLLLAHRDDRLELRWNAPAAPRPFSVDFVAGPAAKRYRSLSRREPLARAVGLGRGTHTVLDATAGLGRDAFALACLGCRVLAVERSPVVAALLADGLRRALADPEGSRRCGDRLELVTGDARTVLLALAPDQRPDTVVIDPMLGATGSARVKKETRLLQDLLGPADPTDTTELLALARRTALRRTAVKRPLRAPALAPDRDASITGTRVRWDVYLS